MNIPQSPPPSTWHQQSPQEVLARLAVNEETGLSAAAAAERLAANGPNELTEHGLKSPWSIIWEQLTDTMVIILIIAAVISIFMGDAKDAIAILAIVVLNALLGFNQEYRAEKAIAALKKLATPAVKVLRDGEVEERSARELVAGDIILLEAGNLVPADGRLLESTNLRIQESVLTGESEPVEKDIRPLTRSDLTIGDRLNMTFMGTIITYGRGRAIITETGMNTELGRIAGMISKVEREDTPMQRRLAQLGKSLAIAALAIVAVIFLLGLLRGEEFRLMFLTAISLAVAVVPEGLPAVVTIALALGAQRMLKKRALVRRLAAVETLGSVTVICSDKTGTLTENRMTVTMLDIAGHTIDLSSLLQDKKTILGKDDPKLSSGELPSALVLSLLSGALCNDAILKIHTDAPGAYHTVGDPTEGALVIAGARFGLHKNELETVLPRQAEIPFDSERKRMFTLHKITADAPPLTRSMQLIRQARPEWADLKAIAFCKGAVDGLLGLSSWVWIDDHAERMNDDWRKRIELANNQMAQSGMRVLGLTFRPYPQALPESASLTEEELVFAGMVGMIDPPRPEVKEAVQTCLTAGIRPIMITGDHPLTARHIAAELGISSNSEVLTGVELAKLTPEELQVSLENISVFARVSPEHKLTIVQALQNQGHIVAMTGDGVNDAPALKKADIGVAMGITGTDVSKEAADAVLLDDNFATIVAAVNEGRVIYDNIRKFIKYALASNAGEMLTMFLGPALGMPLPLLPLQLLWINLVTDGLPGLALGLEKAERDTMRRPPHPPNENIFARGMGRHILLIGTLLGLISLGSGYLEWLKGNTHWQTMIFVTLCFTQMFHVLAVRSDRDSLFTIGIASNRPLLGVVILTILLQVSTIYVPFLQTLFETLPLTFGELALCFVVSSLVLWFLELDKWHMRRKALR
jgi:P-type Ca2+ transporter type 2C